MKLNMRTHAGSLAKNQYIIRENGKVYFQSYESIIAEIDYTTNSPTITLGYYWNYSNTTRKYLYKFLYEVLGISVNKAEIMKEIKSGKIRYNENLY